MVLYATHENEIRYMLLPGFGALPLKLFLHEFAACAIIGTLEKGNPSA